MIIQIQTQNQTAQHIMVNTFFHKQNTTQYTNTAHTKTQYKNENDTHMAQNTFI